MADPEVRLPGTEVSVEDLIRDVDTAGGDSVEIIEVLETGTGAANGEEAGLEEIEEDEKVPLRLTFIDYLKSPIIELLVGSGESQTILSAHQALLVRSPFFAEAISRFSEDATTRRIELAEDDLEAIGAFLQWLYVGEYFPRKINDAQGAGLESDPDLLGAEDNGEQLLKHARVYTLAEKIGVMELKALAHSKVHLINSSARGEIAYARYVYATTPRSDVVIRKPIASFWGQRSHVLRHEAEDDFKKLCLEFPEFGFDVLSYVLDARERKSTTDRQAEEPKSSRKRARVSDR
ncbi:hypothetical protein MMC24_006052 [Lignoscripta atroalba]|nr:hypothetical protein [Lignoscripta atroalba]